MTGGGRFGGGRRMCYARSVLRVLTRDDTSPPFVKIYLQILPHREALIHRQGQAPQGLHSGERSCLCCCGSAYQLALRREFCPTTESQRRAATRGLCSRIHVGCPI